MAHTFANSLEIDSNGFGDGWPASGSRLGGDPVWKWWSDGRGAGGAQDIAVDHWDLGGDDDRSLGSHGRGEW